MDGPTLEPLPRFNTISYAEKVNVIRALKAPLSGYLGGIDKAGYFVTRLQNEWCDRFKVKHAIACNSATSGLLAACMAIGIKSGDTVWVSAMGMSATAACAKVLGANIVFIDIETKRFSMNMNHFPSTPPKAIIVTNLFGHPAYLGSMRSWCDSNKVWMIEDAAQSPFAEENGKYAGTVGHIGCFSFNVHKHCQSGEGGICVTNDDNLGNALNAAINHGELAGSIVGLNLRMTEPTAAIACAQLAKADRIISTRIALAEQLTDIVAGLPFIETHRADVGCKHVYYKWIARVTNGNRDKFAKAVIDRGFPITAGYSPLLTNVFNVNQEMPVAARMEYNELIAFDVCAYDPKARHLKKMRDIFWKAAGEMNENS